MIKYKQMAEIARTPGKFLKLDNLGDPTAKAMSLTDAERDEFWRRYQSARVFVFDSHAWPMPGDDAIVCAVQEEPQLDVPFQTCSFESLPHDGKDWLIAHGETEAVFLCILLHEICPGKYDLYALGGGPDKRPRLCYIPWIEGQGNALAWLNVIWLDRLRTGVMGTEEVREKVKIGTGSGKIFHPIRRIIRVVPHAMKGRVTPAFSREIDWSHRWAVRGHWRRHEGLGKNRAGEYCVEGFTWVTEHIRGPEDAPLIEKVRFVPAPVTPARVAEKESVNDE